MAREEIEQQLIEPLVQQLGIDAGDTVANLARGRLGVGAGAESVRNQSKSLGVTRARVYQMLEECHNQRRGIKPPPPLVTPPPVEAPPLVPSPQVSTSHTSP